MRIRKNRRRLYRHERFRFGQRLSLKRWKYAASCWVRHPETAAIVGQLAYVSMGDPNRAEPLFVEALAIIEKTLGPETLEASRLHERMALLYQTKSQFADAEAFSASSGDCPKVLEVDHFANAVIKVGLAQTLLSRGNAQSAATHRRRFDDLRTHASLQRPTLV